MRAGCKYVVIKLIWKIKNYVWWVIMNKTNIRKITKSAKIEVDKTMILIIVAVSALVLLLWVFAIRKDIINSITRLFGLN